ncbi:MAG TPA: UMP kinase [Caldithrix sp.]|nr:UMP kinase [Caldithrix sp.]
MAYKRILLKLSGESLAGTDGQGVSQRILEYFASEIKKVYDLGVELAIVIGGGNFFRGLSNAAKDMNRVTADQMGMLATMINSLALMDILKRNGVKTQVFSAISMPKIADVFDHVKVTNCLNNGKVAILGGGTGNPFFTTDTAAVLRAVEIGAEVILKGTRVDGVYSADPEKVTDAIKYDTLSYMEVVERKLKVMDITAITLAMDNKLPMVVFNFDKADNLKKIVLGESVGTKVRE